MNGETPAATGAIAHSNTHSVDGPDDLPSVIEGTAPDPLHVAGALIEWGASIFVARRNTGYVKGAIGPDRQRVPEFVFPPGWPDIPPDLNVLARWEPGAAVCVVTGSVVDAVDIDPKNGADVDDQLGRLRAAGVLIVGLVRTPSDGVHAYMRSTGLRSSSNRDVGVDFRGRGEDGSGAGAVYLPGTTRPKYDGAGYRWIQPLDLDAARAADRQEQRAAVRRYFAGLGVSVTTTKAAAAPLVGDIARAAAVVQGRLQRLLADPGPWVMADGTMSTDVSQRFHHLVNECRRASCSLEQTARIMASWPSLPERYSGRVNDEVMRSWNPASAPSARPNTAAQWFSKEGLAAAELAADVEANDPLRRDRGDSFWIYQQGVWRPDRDDHVRSQVTDRLQNRFRPSHLATIKAFLLGQVPVLEPRPVPRFLNVPNGLLDWATGDLLVHDPDVLSTVQLAVDWDPSATCPVIEDWLAQVLPADLLVATGDSPGFIWELLGYLCFSGNPLHKAVLLLGSGRNGKGTLLRLLTELLGADNVCSVDLHSMLNNRFRVAELVGKVANIAGDVDGSWLENTAVLKAITGGDRIQAERKYGQPFDFTPFAVPVFSANKVFGTPDTTDGYLSRWLVIPFPHSFTGVEDRGLDQRLQQPDQLAGMLVKAVAGLQALMARARFTTPASVAEAHSRFAEESDPVRVFIQDVSEPHTTGWETRGAVWDSYEDWAADSGVFRKLTRSQLYARLEAAGWPPRTRNGVRGFGGRRLNPGPYG